MFQTIHYKCQPNWKWKIENWKLKIKNDYSKSWTSIMKWWTIAWIMLLIRMQARNVLLWIERYWHKCYNIENHLWFVGDVCALLFVGWYCGWCSTARVTNWNGLSVQLVVVVGFISLFVSCWCCSNYYISKECHVHTLKWMEMSDGCLLHRYFVGFCMKIPN